MFDIFCYKITLVFRDTQVDVNDLIDLGKVVSIPATRKQLMAKLNKLLDNKKNEHANKEL